MTADNDEWYHVGAALRSGLAPDVWVAHLAYIELASTEAGGIRSVKAYMVDMTAYEYGQHRWIRTHENCWDLEMKETS